MQKRHKNREQYFKEQEYTTKKYVIPYIQSISTLNEKSNILEIGCGEGGNLKPFLDLGFICTGIDLSQSQINNATEYFQEHPYKSRLRLICQNIYDFEPNQKYDVIVLRDVIEHIPDQQKFMKHLKKFIPEKGIIFFGFPPWQMPFGGHQQVLRNKLLSKLPYFHLLPASCYKFTLKLGGENEGMIESRMDIKKTGISTERFEKIVKTLNYKVDKRTYYFINPNYEIKFGLKPRTQLKLITKLPYIKNFFTTAVYYVISENINNQKL